MAGQGYRNGVREGCLKTAEGFIGYSAPQVAGTAEPFGSELRRHLKGPSEALEDLAVEMLARGLSVRDIEDAFKDETGRLLLSRRRYPSWASGCGRTTRTSSPAIWANTTSFICSSTGSRSGFGPGRGARPCWRPGASRAPVPGFSCI